MVQETNTQHTIPDDIAKRAPTASEFRQLRRRISEEIENLPAHGSQRTKIRKTRRQSVGYAVGRVLHALSTWRDTVVKTVESGIHEFWSSIILSHAKSYTPLRRSFQVDMLGAVRFYDVRYENVVYSVQTVTGNTPLSSKTTTPTMTSEQSSLPSLEPTKSRSDEYAEKLRLMQEGTLDLNTITLREWIEISYLAMFDRQELNLDINIIEGGNRIHLHTCVQAIAPPVGSQPLGIKQ